MLTLFTRRSAAHLHRAASLATVLIPCLLALAAPLCAQSSAADLRAPVSMDRLIDPAITGVNRAVIARVMRTLAPEDREKVVYITEDGRVFANRPWLYGIMERQIQVGPNQFLRPNGQTVTYPALSPKPSATGVSLTPFAMTPNSVTPPPTGDSGPFRRVFSQPGYAWQQSTVRLGSNASPVDIYLYDPDYGGGVGTENAFVYMGGWGDIGGSVDAGFQHSYTNDWWSLFIAYEGGPPNFTTQPAGYHFQSNQDVTFKFYVSSDNNLATVATGKTYPAGFVKTLTVVQTVAASFGWHASGAGNVLKRMTTIGQPVHGGVQYDGSFHKNVHWYNCMIGTTASSNHHTGSSTDTGTNGYQSFPTSNITVNFVSPAEETDNIQL